MLMTSQRLEYLLAVSISIFALVIYVVTLCPTVSFIDSGELATDVYTLGIAHPTGYPFFTLVGYLFSHLPLGLRVIYQVNLMAAIFCSAGLFFFFRFLVFFLNVVTQKHPKNIFSKNLPLTEQSVLQIFVPAAAGTLILAFSETYWSQALAVEVYSVHVFFLSLLLLLFTKALSTELFGKEEEGGSGKGMSSWLLFAVVLGLSFANHMTTILLAPAFLVAFFYVFKIQRGWKQILRLVIPFLVGFSAYIYLPVRAAMKPAMNWGNPVDFERFMWHFSGKVYRVWIFSSFESAGKQFQYFIDSLPGEFAYVPVVLALIGVWSLYKNNKPALMFTLLLFLGCIGYSINYDIHDIDSYFLLAYVTIAVWCALGVREITQMVKSIQKVKIVAGGTIALCVFMLVTNYKKVDESTSYLVEDYAKDVFNSIEPNGIVISYQWDYFVSAAYYLQLVEKVRPDVVVIDKELLRRTWYLQQLEQRYPWLIKQSRVELDAYAAELYKFEHTLPYNPSVIEFRYTGFIHSLIEKNIVARSIYVTPEIETQYTQGYQRVPSGITFRLYGDSTTHETFSPHFSFRTPQKIDKYADGILSMYSQAYLNNALYANMTGRKEDAMQSIEKSLEIRPDYTEARVLKERIKSEMKPD